MENKLAFREYYKRRLPHIQIAGATYFITFRLVNSLPIEALNKLAVEKQKSTNYLNVRKNPLIKHGLPNMMIILIRLYMETHISKMRKLQTWWQSQSNFAMEKYTI